MLPFCRNTDTRKRASVAVGEAEVGAALLLEFLLVALGVIAFISATVSSESSTLVSSDAGEPCRRRIGASADVRWRSRALLDDGFEQSVNLNR
jgi:hypothetical protein